LSFAIVLQILGLLGGLAGAITLVWRLIDVSKAFLHIGIAVEKMEGSRVKVRTVIENKNSIARKLDGAYLIVSPVDEDPYTTARTLVTPARETIFNTYNEMARAVTTLINTGEIGRLEDNSGRMIIPLPYYYIEN
jgi:hypothetical protein